MRDQSRSGGPVAVWAGRRLLAVLAAAITLLAALPAHAGFVLEGPKEIVIDPYPLNLEIATWCKVLPSGIPKRSQAFFGPAVWPLSHQGDRKFVGYGTIPPVAPGTYPLRIEIEHQDGTVAVLEQQVVLGPYPPEWKPPVGWLPPTMDGLTIKPIDLPSVFYVQDVHGLTYHPPNLPPKAAPAVGITLPDRHGWVHLPPAKAGSYGILDLASGPSPARRFVRPLPVATAAPDVQPVQDLTVEAGCTAAKGKANFGAGALLLAAVVLVLGRRRSLAGLAVMGGFLGCTDQGPDTRQVGSREALVEVVAPGSGPTNTAPLWPLELGSRIDQHIVVSRWEVPGGHGLRLRPSGRGDLGYTDFLVNGDGLWVDRVGTSGQLSHPLWLLPAQVRQGMIWRTHAVPPMQSVDLLENLIDPSGDWEYRVLSRTESQVGATVQIAWRIAWKGPRCSVGDLADDHPRPPVQGELLFVEGRGPVGPMLPALPTHEHVCNETISTAVQPLPIAWTEPRLRIRPQRSPAAAVSAPGVALSPVTLPKYDVWASDLSVLDLGKEGVWLRLDGNSYGSEYGILGGTGPGGSGGVGGNTTGYSLGPTSRCFRVQDGKLLDGKATGVLEQGQTCKHAASSLVDAPGLPGVARLPLAGAFGQTLAPSFVNFNKAGKSTAVGSFPYAALVLGDQTPAMLVRHTGKGWRLLPFTEVEDYDKAYTLDDLDALHEVSFAGAGRACLDLDNLLATPVGPASGSGTGAHALICRSGEDLGHVARLGHARMDPDRVVRDAHAVAWTGGRVAVRRDTKGSELWLLEPDGLLWRLRSDGQTLLRQPVARLQIPDGHLPVAAVRAGGRQVVVVTSQGADGFTSYVAKVCASHGYCTGQMRPGLGRTRAFTGTLPAEHDGGWQPFPAIAGLVFEFNPDNPPLGSKLVPKAPARVCLPKPGALGTVLVDGATWSGPVSDDGRCLDLAPAVGVAGAPWQPGCLHTLAVEVEGSGVVTAEVSYCVP